MNLVREPRALLEELEELRELEDVELADLSGRETSSGTSRQPGRPSRFRAAADVVAELLDFRRRRAERSSRRRGCRAARGGDEGSSREEHRVCAA